MSSRYQENGQLTQRTLPGIDQACFQTAEMAITAMTWAKGQGPLCE